MTDRVNIHDEGVIKAHKMAVAAQKRAYAPYSQFKVGAVVKLKDQDVWVSGHNIENASYGASVCAERIAIFNALSNHTDLRDNAFDYLLLVTDTPDGDVPCGLCLQVISEFAGPDFPVVSANLEEIKKVYRFGELFPYPFDKASL